MKRLLFITIFLLFSAPAFAQGCSLCKNSAAAASPRSQKALGRGIIVLLVPSLTLMIGFATLAYRNRH